MDAVPASFAHWRGIIHHYRPFLPVTEATPVITLYEGNTPLVPAQNLSKDLGHSIELWLKLEGLNPTCSFKDRGMTVAVSKAVEEGAKAVICASTGNTSASAAAYAARAGIACAVLVPNGEIALGKLAQAMMHRAKVLAVDGNFDEALQLVRDISERYPIQLVNSINPYRIEGQKTGAFEICDQLGRAPDYQAMPVGNAGNITAYWRGYSEYFHHGLIEKRPVMLGFQAWNAAPIVDGHPIRNPQTVATAIKIGNPASWKTAIQARDESGGLIAKIKDEDILKAYRLLASREGIFVEPASAISLAGVLMLHQQGYFPKGATVVCILTGHGLKDPDRAIAESPKPRVVPPQEAVIVEEIFS
ncbi:MAG: threonine synthase [Candidatus Poribacteria bacterium]|nr:MAG: threonine synthase [Candidatus Poribacteria bacterium]